MLGLVMNTNCWNETRIEIGLMAVFIGSARHERATAGACTLSDHFVKLAGCV